MNKLVVALIACFFAVSVNSAFAAPTSDTGKHATHVVKKGHMKAHAKAHPKAHTKQVIK
jgi:hypothetical protein